MSKSATQPTAEELCGSVNRVDTLLLGELVSDFVKLYGTSVATRVAKGNKTAAEKRLIEAIKANLDRYEG